MDEYVKEVIVTMELKSPTTEYYLKEIEMRLGISFPIQYKEFMMVSNGAVGNIGDNYLLIWSIEETAEINEINTAEEINPELVYFGSDGGDMAYAFDNKTGEASIITFPFISIVNDESEFCGHTFNEFLMNLYNR